MEGTDNLNLNLDGLLTGRITSLRNVIRYSIFHRGHDESVAEHTYFTTLYALIIGQWVGMRALRAGEPIHIIASVMTLKALLHDVDEAQSGDIIRRYKHSSPELRGALKDAAAKFVEGILEEIHLPETEEFHQLFGAWALAKDNTIEGRIVALADYLSVVSYISQELRAGNGNMKECLKELEEYGRQFETTDYEFIRPIVCEARRFVANLSL